MTSLMIWMTAFTIATCLGVVAAAAGMPELHLGVTAAIALAIAGVGVHTLRSQAAAGANRSAISATVSRHVGFVWIWAAVTILIIYGFVLSWRETWQFVAGLSVVGALCLGLATLFDKDAAAGREDDSLLKVGRGLNIVQIVGMLAVIAGLIADNKFMPTMRGALKVDWAANTVFFFGAVAVAVIGVFALAHERDARKTQP